MGEFYVNNVSYVTWSDVFALVKDMWASVGIMIEPSHVVRGAPDIKNVHHSACRCDETLVRLHGNPRLICLTSGEYFSRDTSGPLEGKEAGFDGPQDAPSTHRKSRYTDLASTV
uniref:Uncharacterized protein n=1 Tax=Paramoeba aestuarina TaxID=180227 RepID=A0A7S4KJQ8_9EUKA